MMNEQYSTLPLQDGDQLESGSYYFSSRGPSPDGYLPDICAPGGSIAPIPRHSLQGKAQYHGTSMSSPNAAGVAACILSAVKQQGMNCNPVELKRALINTATPIGIIDSFAQGNGVVQASNCVDYIMATHGKGGQNIEFEVSLPSRNNARGLYIRDESELSGPLTFGVLVKPKFSHSNQRTDSEMEELLNLNLNLKLKASKTWVTCPDQITMLSAQDRGGQSFSIRLKVEDLAPGVHFATVDATDDDDLSRGSLFSVPVTVIIPHHSSGEDYSTTFQLTQGRPDRRFLTVPLGAEWATIKLTGNSKKDALAAPRILVHAVPFVRGDLPNSLIQMKKIYQVKEGVEEEFHICVKGGHTLELCLQLLWLANPLPATVNALIEFHGLGIRSPTLLSSQPVTISSAQQFARLGINTPLRTEKINPTGKFTSVRRTIIPHEYDIKVATNELLDFVPPSDAELQAHPDTLYSQMYEMRLTYKFTIKTEKENKAIPVRPSFPSLFNQLYDSPVDSQLWSLVESQSQTLTFGGAVHEVQPVSLKKGDYRICLLLRHSERSTLEKLTNIPCELLLTLPDVFPCDIYSELDKASTPTLTLKDDGRSTIKAVTLKRGSHKDLYVSRPTKDLPSWTEVGDVLVGSLVLDKDNAAVTTLQLLYNVPPKSSVKDAKEDKAAEKKKKDTLDDVLFKARLDYTAGLRKNSTKSSLEEYEQNLTALIEERPSSVPLLLERLSFSLETETLERTVPSTEEEDKWRAKEVELVYNDMLKTINPSVLARYFGGVEPSKEDLEDDEEAKELNKDMKEQRSALKKILLSRALISSKVVEKDDTSSSAVSDELDRAVKEMKRWVAKADHLDDDEDKSQLSIILARHAISQDKKSTALSILLKARKDLDGKELKQIDEEVVKLYVLFGDMDHLVQNMKESIEARYPTKPRKL